MKRLILTLMATIITGCASLPSSLPEGYTGKVSKIQDTELRIDQGKANLFCLIQVDGKPIQNSRIATRIASNGQGDYLTTILLNNTVTASEHSFTILGRTEYAMPIRAFTGDVFEIKGDVSFTPKPDRQYIIKGDLSEKDSSIWIEDVETQEVIGKIVQNGSSKLGFFDK